MDENIENKEVDSESEEDVLIKARLKNTIEPLYYPVFFVAIFNLIVLFVAQPLAFWTDYSQHNLAPPFNYLVEIHPLFYLAVYIFYLISLAVLLSILPKVFARVVGVATFMFHIWALSSWTKTLLAKFGFPTDFYVVSYTSLGLLILVGGISFLLVHFAPKMRPFELVSHTKKSNIFLDVIILLSAALIACIFVYTSHTLKVYEEIDYTSNIISKGDITYDGPAVFRSKNEEDGEIVLYPHYQYNIDILWVGEYNMPSDMPTDKKEYDKWFREWKRSLSNTGQVSILSSDGMVVASSSAYVTEGYCKDCGFEKYSGQIFDASFDEVLLQLPNGEYTAVLNLDSGDRIPSEIVSETFRVEKFDVPKIEITDYETDSLYPGAATTSISWKTENIPERLWIRAHLVSEKCVETECHQSIRGEHRYSRDDFVDLGSFSNSGKLEFKYDEFRREFPLPPGKYKYVLSFNNVPYNTEKAIHRLDPDYFIYTETDYFDVNKFGSDDDQSPLLNVVEGQQINEFMSVESVWDGGQYGYRVVFTGELPVRGVFSREHHSDTFGELDYITVNDDYKDLIPSVYSNREASNKFCLTDTGKDIVDQLQSTDDDSDMVITTVTYRHNTEKVNLCPVSVTVGSVKDTEDITVASAVLEDCFVEIPFDQYEVEQEGSKSLGEGFVIWLPDSLTMREPDESNHEQGDYIIESPDGHKAEVSFIYLKSEVLRSRYMHNPSVTYEPNSNRWWFEQSFGQPAAECTPNSTGTTKFSDPIYLTQDGDAGAFFKIFTLVSNKRLKQPVSGYADAVQIKLTGNGNDPNYQSYEDFEETVLKIMYNMEASITRG